MSSSTARVASSRGSAVFVPGGPNDTASVAELGGKAYSLFLLGRDAVPAPAWFCVTIEAWKQLEQRWGEAVRAALDAVDWTSPQSIAVASERLQQLAKSVELPSSLVTSISQALEDLGGDAFAVRSSATLEDSGTHSFAGQLDSYLYVPAPEVLECVRRCWASAFTQRCLSYVHLQGIDPAELAVAVVVQQMVDSQTSGVLFTADPTGASEDLIIAAGYGLGEGVVSDQVETDTYRLSSSGAWEELIATKTQRVVRSRAGTGTRLESVEPARAEQAVLSVEQRSDLATLGRQIAEQRGAPQDIEWAYDSEQRLFITQTRPVTALGGPVAVYDNSNVVESYPGITLPLTFSHVRHGYEELFRRVLLRLGVPPGKVRQEHAVFEQLVGHVCGRVYYNLSNWYRMFALIPGTERYLPVWEKMLGIEQPLSTSRQRGLMRYVGMTQIASRFAWGCLWIRRDLDQLRERFHEERQRFAELPLDELSLADLLAEYDALNHRMLPDWDLTLLNDGYAFLFSGLCRGLLTRSGCAEDAFVDLVAAGGELESVLPVQALEALARQLAALPEVRVQVEAALEREPKQALAAFAANSELQAALTQYLEQWGDRSLGELKLEAPSFAEAPEELLRLILRYLARPESAAGVTAARGRATASRVAELPRGYPARWVLAWCAQAARRSIRLRESSRFDRARAFGMLRRLFTAAGRRLVKEGVLEGSRDVFYLEIAELRQIARQAGAADWRALVKERKARFERMRQLEPPPRIALRGAVERYVPPVISSELAEGALTGQACAAGQVQAPARVVLVPDYSIDATGQVLVAPATDPGWVFLMATAAGLVVEKGSLLSHSAIVGRELGIPTVVGVQGATRRIQTGQQVFVDGSRGIVEVRSGEEETA